MVVLGGGAVSYERGTPVLYTRAEVRGCRVGGKRDPAGATRTSQGYLAHKKQHFLVKGGATSVKSDDTFAQGGFTSVKGGLPSVKGGASR